MIKKHVLAEACACLANDLQKFIDSGYDVTSVVSSQYSGGICSVQAALGCEDVPTAEYWQFINREAAHGDYEQAYTEVLCAIRSALAGYRDDIFGVWPHFSGHIGYPVPAKPYRECDTVDPVSPHDAFYESGERRFNKSPYGLLRRDLVQYMVRMYRIKAVQGASKLRLDHLVGMKAALVSFRDEYDYNVDEFFVDADCHQHIGICKVLYQSITGGTAYDGLYRFRDELTDDEGLYYDYKNVVNAMFTQWPKYSGNISYPVPHKDKDPLVVYIAYGPNKFIGEYGETRKELMEFMIQAFSFLIRSY